jgi:hypothetical protein
MTGEYLVLVEMQSDFFCFLKLEVEQKKEDEKNK